MISLILSGFHNLAARQWDTQGAARAYEEAGRKQSEIAGATQATPGQYLECARTYRKVYLRNPHYRHAGDAIYQEARIYQEMGDRFSDLEYYKTAARRFQFLVDDYGGNQNCPDALLRLAAIYSKHLKDEIAAKDAYQHLKLQYKYSGAILPSAHEESSPIPAPPPAAQAAPVPGAAQSATAAASIQSIRYWSTSDYTRVIVDMDSDAPYQKTRLQNPDRFLIDIADARLSRNFPNRSIAVGDGLLKQIRVAQNRQHVVRVVLDISALGDYAISELHNPFRIVIDLHPKPAAGIEPKPAVPSPLVSPEPKGAVSSSQDVESKTQPPPLPVTNAGPPVSKEAKPIPSSPPPNAVKTPLASTAEGIKGTVEPAGRPEAKQAHPAVAIGEAKQPPPAVTGMETSPPKDVRPAQTLPPGGAAKQGDSRKADSSTKPPSAIGPGAGGTPKSPAPTSHGDRTLTRMLGLKIGRIVIDPGHGGHDLGTTGPGGLLEKNLVLNLALELQKQLEERLGAEVILTRNDDTFIPLEERTAIANQHHADLFVSIHANSSRQRSISGVETYFLDFARTDAEREIAARENATSAGNVRDLEDLIKKIAKADKSAESRELASILQKRLCSGLRKLFPSAKNRGVRSAPFVVLIGANMPSVLAEVAFISNPRDERLLNKKPNQELLAKALFSGIESYMKTLGSDVVRNQANPK